MILNKIIIKGYKRFENSSMLIDRKLVSIIGPNESGKTSFFNALTSLENKNPIPQSHITDGVVKEDSDRIVEAQYIIESSEKEFIDNLSSNSNPRFYSLYKVKSGETYHKIIGDIERDKTLRESLVVQLSKLITTQSHNSLITNHYFEETIENDGEDEEDEVFQTSLRELINEFVSLGDLAEETLSESTLRKSRIIKSTFYSPEEPKSKISKKAVDKISLLIDEFNEAEEKNHPKDQLLIHLDAKRQKFLLFGGENRFIKGNYSLEELKERVPSSLQNLFAISTIDLDDVIDSTSDEATSRRFTLQKTANKHLEEAYTSSWSQSTVYPQFLFDIDSIKIQIFYSDSYTEIGRRSEGLKQYISLKAFLHQTGYIKPILLIDEAELHLHYSAQSDLIQEFEKQELVDSIIYSTHSAGCLPSDLGTGIRVVEPIFSDDADTGRSIIKNSIWQNTGGFSPILIAMGANVLAFTPARKALIAEGPSETILLPRILREGTEKNYLDFQIAPGIASVSKEEAVKFEFEAGKVTYLVDGDRGGKRNKKKLIDGGIDPKKIFSLKEDQTLEDFLKIDILIDAINRELKNSGHNQLDKNTLGKMPRVGRITFIEEYCKNNQIKFPSKVKIAENIIKEQSNTEIILKNSKKELLKLHNQISSVLEK